MPPPPSLPKDGFHTQPLSRGASLPFWVMGSELHQQERQGTQILASSMGKHNAWFWKLSKYTGRVPERYWAATKRRDALYSREQQTTFCKHPAQWNWWLRHRLCSHVLGILFQLFLLLMGKLNKLAPLRGHLLICKVDTLIPFTSQAGGRDKMRKVNIFGGGVFIPTGQVLLIMSIVNIDLLSLSFEVFFINNQFEDLRKHSKLFSNFFCSIFLFT